MLICVVQFNQNKNCDGLQGIPAVAGADAHASQKALDHVSSWTTWLLGPTQS